MGSLATQESAVSDFIEILQAHLGNCERLGKYVEAEIARCVIGPPVFVRGSRWLTLTLAPLQEAPR